MPVTRASQWEEQLRVTDESGIRAILSENSGLPGPRGNLELADAFAAVAPASVIRAYAHSDDEYLRFCGTEALGRLVLADPQDTAVMALLVQRAGDNFWRVREAAARAVQIVGDGDRGLMRRIVSDWVGHPEAFVRRAAVAAIAEPRLLRDDETQAAALDACARATESIRILPAPERKREGVQNLRQALGYCWSVAIAAAPQPGLAAWERLVASTEANHDRDMAWIVKTNLTKKRLARLLG